MREFRSTLLVGPVARVDEKHLELVPFASDDQRPSQQREHLQVEPVVSTGSDSNVLHLGRSNVTNDDAKRRSRLVFRLCRRSWK